MIKMVVSDMDGTLLNRQGKISKQNADAVHLLQESGIKFMVCTGRSYTQARRALATGQIECSMICINGAAVYEETGHMTEQFALSMDQVNAVVSICGKYQVSLEVMTERGNCIISDRETYLEFYRSYLSYPLDQSYFISPQELSAWNCTCFKVSVLSDDFPLLELIRNELSCIEHLAVSSSYQTNLELTHESAQKGEALKRYAERSGISMDEIMGIGDNDNDISMLSLPLGYSVAMRNATDKLKATCRFITDSNEDNGVASAIEMVIHK